MQVVLDSDHPTVRNNQCFNLDSRLRGAGSGLWPALAEECERRGWTIETSDVVLARSCKPVEAAAIVDMVSPRTDALLSAGVRPAVCYSLESPVMAPVFYHRMAGLAGRFAHNFQFRGTAFRLAGTGSQFHALRFPMEPPDNDEMPGWSERRHIVIVNSNKRIMSINRSSPGEIVRSLARNLRLWAWMRTDPVLRVRTLHDERLRAIVSFSRLGELDLWGIGWDQPLGGVTKNELQVLQSAWRGPIALGGKRAELRNHRFTLCFENCVFPGYVTEKIFDALLAGSVPIYLGAPDITGFVPQEAFIDYQAFRSLTELGEFLRAMPEATWQRYLEAGYGFLNSEQFRQHHVTSVACQMLDAAAACA